MATNFFRAPDDDDIADKRKLGVDNLAKAVGLDSRDGDGWDTLADYAAENTAAPDPQRQGVFCAPAQPTYDDDAADDLVDTTQTDDSDWVFPLRDGLEVRAAAKQDSAVVDKLGLYLVRLLSDDDSFVKVMAPSGTMGFVPMDCQSWCRPAAQPQQL